MDLQVFPFANTKITSHKNKATEPLYLSMTQKLQHNHGLFMHPVTPIYIIQFKNM